jgi:hypothetical protein
VLLALLLGAAAALLLCIAVAPPNACIHSDRTELVTHENSTPSTEKHLAAPCCTLLLAEREMLLKSESSYDLPSSTA